MSNNILNINSQASFSNLSQNKLAMQAKYNTTNCSLSQDSPQLNEQTLAEIRQILIQETKERKQNLDSLKDEELWQNLKSICNHLLLHKKISIENRLPLMQASFDQIRGLGIIQTLLDDKSITEIMINGAKKIFIEQDGKIKNTNLSFKNEAELNDFINKIFSRCNKRIDNLHPIADGILSDGSRMNAILSPISVDGSSLTIRKFCGLKQDIDTLLKRKTISNEALLFLKDCILQKKSLFICGGTGSGKTTLLNILSSFIPNYERVITIEDACELELQNLPNWIRLEARVATLEDKGNISISDLIKSSLRMRPDRLIVGEIRGNEAYDLINAANTGHPGSLSTGHANSCQDMVRRLANLIMSTTRLPYEVILENIKGAFPYFIYLQKLANGERLIIEIAELKSTNGFSFDLKPVFIYKKEMDCLKRNEV